MPAVMPVSMSLSSDPARTANEVARVLLSVRSAGFWHEPSNAIAQASRQMRITARSLRHTGAASGARLLACSRAFARLDARSTRSPAPGKARRQPKRAAPQGSENLCDAERNQDLVVQDLVVQATA